MFRGIPLHDGSRLKGCRESKEMVWGGASEACGSCSYRSVHFLPTHTYSICRTWKCRGESPILMPAGCACYGAPALLIHSDAPKDSGEEPPFQRASLAVQGWEASCRRGGCLGIILFLLHTFHPMFLVITQSQLPSDRYAFFPWSDPFQNRQMTI